MLCRIPFLIIFLTPALAFVKPPSSACFIKIRQDSMVLSQVHRSQDVATAPNVNLEAAAGPTERPPYSLGPHLKVSKRLSINLYGVLFTLNSIFLGMVIFPFVFVAGLIGRVVDPKRLRLASAVGNWWSKLILITLGIKPQVTGLENLPPPGEAVVYLPNHTSYLDVPVTGWIPGSTAKYLTKAELKWLPLVGWKAIMAGDILVKRTSAETFRRLIVMAALSLRRGNSLVAFPEGTRSKDGRLGSFKKGPFVMAAKAGVKIVPVTITGVAEVMPPHVLAPIRRPKNVRIHLHPAIGPFPPGAPVEEHMAQARKIIASGLPPWQQPRQM